MAKAYRVTVYVLFLLTFVAISVSNIALRRQLDEARRGANRPRLVGFRVGEIVPAFETRDVLNRAVTLGGRSERQPGRLLVFVHPKCGFCTTLLDAISKTDIRKANVTVVSILPQRASADVTKRLAGKAPAYFMESANSAVMSRTRVVPQVIRISDQGTVVEVCARSAFQQCLEHAELAAAEGVTHRAL